MRHMHGTVVSTRSAAVMLSLCLVLVGGCGSDDGVATSPSELILAGTVWSGPFADSGLGSGTLTLTFGPTEGAVGRWALDSGNVTVLAGLRVIEHYRTDSADVVTLGLSTPILNPDCDMLLTARINGAQMRGNLRIGRCESQGERLAEVLLTRR